TQIEAQGLRDCKPADHEAGDNLEPMFAKECHHQRSGRPNKPFCRIGPLEIGGPCGGTSSNSAAKNSHSCGPSFSIHEHVTLAPSTFLAIIVRACPHRWRTLLPIPISLLSDMILNPQQV